jgi:hypothetical protein
MCGAVRNIVTPFLLAMSVIYCAGSGASAEDAAWRVSKSSGDVSVVTSGVQQAALTDGAILKPGDSIRTGQTGRVLLMRGEESILISPNSVIDIPNGRINGMSTTIIQQAGSILLDVEKRNVKHFEVDTPYLAAVVKGTKFRVTVNKNESNVDVLRGQVEVMDFKSGQTAMVLPGQTASVSTQGQTGLSLSGSGILSPIQQGEPRQPSVVPLSAVKEALAAAGDTANESKVRDALALGDGVSVPVLSGTSTANEWWNGSDSLTFDLAVPFGAGFVVAVGVAAQRRRQRQTKTHPPTPTAS